MDIKDYTDLGWMNNWESGNYHPKYIACVDAKHQCQDADQSLFPHRGTHHVVACDICKIVYHYDSSD